MSTILSDGRPAAQIPGDNDTKLSCAQCTNAMNNELTTTEVNNRSLPHEACDKKQEMKYTYCMHTYIILITALVALSAIIVSALFDKSCHVIAGGKGLKLAIEGERPVGILVNVDRNGQMCSTPMQIPTCWLESKISGKSTNCTVTKIDDNILEISYQATSRGRHQLHIKVEGEHIKGSPFTVTVIMKTPLKIIDGLKKPRGVAVNQKGEIHVAEKVKSGYNLSIFTSTKDKESFGSFFDVFGVALDGDGNILVADCAIHRIYKFSPEHEELDNVGSHGNKSLQFDGPLSTTISPTTKKIAITEWENHRVQILNPDLKFYKQFGSNGRGNGQFNGPHDVAFDSAGNMYVTDARNNRVQVFNPEGQFLRQFGKKINGDAGLNSPAGISIDSDDTVYVTEVKSHRVSVFTHDGKFLASLGSEGGGPGQFKTPFRITVDKNGLIYVSDTDNNRLQIF